MSPSIPLGCTRVIVEEIASQNWRVERGPPREGHGRNM
jgi:hypothetical protein